MPSAALLHRGRHQILRAARVVPDKEQVEIGPRSLIRRRQIFRAPTIVTFSPPNSLGS